MNERERLSRAEFMRFAGLAGLGAAAGTGVGALITQWLYQGRLESLSQTLAVAQAGNEVLLELSRLQQEELNILLLESGALKVEVQKAQIEELKTSIQATQDAWDLREYRVEATSEAYSQDRNSLEEMMEKIPLSLIQNSCKVLFDVSKYALNRKPRYLRRSGSGTVIVPDRRKNLLVCLTAAHVLSMENILDFESETVIDSLNLSRSQLPDRKMVFSPEHFKLYTNWTNDVGIAVLDTSQNQSPNNFQQEINIDENWSPQVGEELYSLSFPSSAERGIGYTPSIFQVVEIEENKQTVQRVIANSLIGGGASGAAVAKADGTIVGIYVEIGTRGSYIVPVGNSYSKLLEIAQL